MYCCLLYWLISPVRKGVEDSASRAAAFTVNVHDFDGKQYEFALYCDTEGVPEFARVVIPDLEAEAIPDATFPLLQMLREHLLSTLRLGYRMDVSLGEPSTIWTFIPEGAPREVKLLVQTMGSRTLDAQKAKDLFTASFEFREVMRLYVDGVDDRIPLQYRFLSLYKLLENRFKQRGSWDVKALASFLQPYEGEFRQLGYEAMPASVLHDLRDRCAHIKTGRGGKREMLGVTHMNLKEAVRVERVLPVLRAISARVVNECAGGNLVLKTEIVQDVWRPLPATV